MSYEITEQDRASLLGLSQAMKTAFRWDQTQEVEGTVVLGDDGEGKLFDVEATATLDVSTATVSEGGSFGVTGTGLLVTAAGTVRLTGSAVACVANGGVIRVIGAVRASETQAGVVKLGAGLEIDEDGVLSASVTDADFTAHTTSTSNPHAVTAAQVGAETTAQLNARDTANRNRANHTGTQAQSTVVNLVTDLAAKAPLASPALTGTPTAPTATAGTNTTQIATTAFVTGAVATNATADRARANHTGTQAQSTVDNLVTDLSDKLSKSAGGTVAGSTVFAGGATRTNTDTNAAAELVTYGQMAKYAQPAMWPHPIEVVEDWSTLDPTVTTSGKLGRMGWLTGGSGSVAYYASRHKIFGRALNMSTGATTDDYRYIGGPTSAATTLNEYSVYRAIFRVSSWANIKLKLGWSDTTQPALGGLNLNCVECDTSVDNNWYYHIKPSSGSESTTLLGAINIPTTSLLTARSISVVIIGHRVNSSQFGGTAGHDRIIITQVNQAGNSDKVVDQEIPNAGTLFNCRPILEVYTKEAAAKTVECELISMGSYFALGSPSNLMF